MPLGPYLAGIEFEKMFPIDNELFGSSNAVAGRSFLKQVASLGDLLSPYECFPRLSNWIRTNACPVSDRAVLPLHYKEFFELTINDLNRQE